MPSVLFYVQHLLGIGHLMRARFVAEALADIGFDVHLVSGGNPIGGRPPRGVRTIQLPPIHATDPGMKPLRDADGHPVDSAYCDRRRDLLLAAFESVAPDVVIFETFPFGRRALHFELLPLLERIGTTRPRPLVVSSVRDILQRRQKVEREREMLALAERWFDAVLVHGDRRFARFDETFPLAPELSRPVHYTGFVVAPDAASVPPFDGRRSEIVVSAGGGAVGLQLLDAALAVQKQIDARRRSVAVPGRRQRVRGRPAATGARCGPWRDRRAGARRFPGAPGPGADLRFASGLQHGARRGSQRRPTGARSVCRKWRNRAAGEGESPARAGSGRGRRRRGHFAGLRSRGPSTSPRRRSDWGRWDFDCDGAARSAALVRDLLAAGLSAARRAPRVHS